MGLLLQVVLLLLLLQLANKQQLVVYSLAALRTLGLEDELVRELVAAEDTELSAARPPHCH